MAPSYASPGDSVEEPPCLLQLNYLLRLVVKARRRTGWPPGQAVQRAMIPLCYSELLAKLRTAGGAAREGASNARKVEVANLQQVVADALAQLSDKQLVVRRTVASLPVSIGEEAVEAELRLKVLDRDHLRAATWQALQDSSGALLRVVGGSTASQASVKDRMHNLQHQVGDVARVLNVCCHAVRAEGALLGHKSPVLEA
eukprot:EG_transcript_13211